MAGLKDDTANMTSSLPKSVKTTASERLNLSPSSSPPTIQSLFGAEEKEEEDEREVASLPREVFILDDTLPCSAGNNDDVVDLTEDDDVIITSTLPVSPNRRRRRDPPDSQQELDSDDDVPLVAVSTTRRVRSTDSDVIVIEKENQTKPVADDFNTSADSRTPKRKMLSCPVCLDHERAIRRDGRHLMSTKCGHIFCNDCIKQTIKNMKCCPTCRTKLTIKTGIHPIFF